MVGGEGTKHKTDMKVRATDVVWFGIDLRI